MRDIPGFEGRFAITSCGKVWSYFKNDFKKLQVDKDGYLRVNMRDANGKDHRFGVHRLVAITYIPNPEDKPKVNHKDENKQNNNINNLEWATMTEQNNYGTHLDKQYKAVRCIETGEVYRSIKEAAAAINGTPQCICQCCKGKQKTHKKLHWEYVL